jgi:hypothetical protein
MESTDESVLASCVIVGLRKALWELLMELEPNTRKGKREGALGGPR